MTKGIDLLLPIADDSDLRMHNRSYLSRSTDMALIGPAEYRTNEHMPKRGILIVAHKVSTGAACRAKSLPTVSFD